MRNQVHLIAYADRLGGSLAALGRLLDGPLAGLFGGMHVLPFFSPYDGADAGFDPVDHLTVDPRLGAWADIRRLGQSLDIVADVIVNHISDRSSEFRDVVQRGGASPYAGMFLTYARVFPGGATEADLLRIVRPRPGLPFTPVVLGGLPRLMWTTFSGRQIDLDSPLFFANAEDFRRRALAAVDAQSGSVRWFVLNMEANVEVDITALDAVEAVRRELEARRIVFALARVKQNLLDDLQAFGLAGKVGPQRIFPTLPTAVAAYEQWRDGHRTG
jgi:hypothetical protein